MNRNKIFLLFTFLTDDEKCIMYNNSLNKKTFCENSKTDARQGNVTCLVEIEKQLWVVFVYQMVDSNLYC